MLPELVSPSKDFPSIPVLGTPQNVGFICHSQWIEGGGGTDSNDRGTSPPSNTDKVQLLVTLEESLAGIGCVPWPLTFGSRDPCYRKCGVRVSPESSDLPSPEQQPPPSLSVHSFIHSSVRLSSVRGAGLNEGNSVLLLSTLGESTLHYIRTGSKPSPVHRAGGIPVLPSPSSSPSNSLMIIIIILLVMHIAMEILPKTLSLF